MRHYKGWQFRHACLSNLQCWKHHRFTKKITKHGGNFQPLYLAMQLYKWSYWKYTWYKSDAVQCLRRVQMTSLAGELAVKAAKSDAECLQGAQRVAEVHREHLVRDPSELHHDVIHCNNNNDGIRTRTAAQTLNCCLRHFLWLPCVADADIIFLSCFFLSFFPRLISAIADWISTILPHMVWP